jgi:predicted nuclease of predicted toxin-antitoxin system
MIARLYSNENFPLNVVEELRRLGHDMLTTRDAGKSNAGIPDDEVLRFATESGRAVITHNRLDFIRLHRQNPVHAGIIVCTDNPDFPALAAKVHAQIDAMESLHGELVRANRGT